MKMFTRLALAASAAALLSTAAFADPMAARFENTIKITGGDGTVMLVMYNADGTLASKTTPAGGTETAGTGKWRVDGDKICVTPNDGPNAGTENCNPLTEHKVGDTWDVTIGGQPAKAEMVAGR